MFANLEETTMIKRLYDLRVAVVFNLTKFSAEIRPREGTAV